MQNIVNLSPEAILVIAEASSRAMAEGKRFRLSFGGESASTRGYVKYKVGEGMWSLPFYDQEDPYRG